MKTTHTFISPKILCVAHFSHRISRLHLSHLSMVTSKTEPIHFYTEFYLLLVTRRVLGLADDVLSHHLIAKPMMIRFFTHSCFYTLLHASSHSHLFSLARTHFIKTSSENSFFTHNLCVAHILSKSRSNTNPKKKERKFSACSRIEGKILIGTKWKLIT